MYAKVTVVFEIGSGHCKEIMRDRECKSAADLKAELECMDLQELYHKYDDYEVRDVEVEE